MFKTQTNAQNKFTYSVLNPQSSELISQIIQIQKSVALNFVEGNVQLLPTDRGFLISGYRSEDFLKLMSIGASILAAVSSKEELVGYIIWTNGSSFAERHPTTTVSWYNSPKSHAISSLYLKGSFTYIDQIAVDPQVQRTGVASNLLKQVSLATGSSKLQVAAVLAEPVSNSASKLFFEKNGFIAIGELFTPKIGQLTNVKSLIMAKLEEEL